MNTEQIDILLARHFANETTEEEELLLKTWILEHKQEYISLKILWADTHDSPVKQIFDTDQAWEKVEPHVVPAKEGHVKSINRPQLNYWLAAACLVIIAGVGLLFYLSSPVKVNTLAGQVKSISLDDGSVVTLNGNSGITYPRRFAANREIELIGEAYFEVKHDARHPFKVRANRLLVNVLGTSFLVKNEGVVQHVVVSAGKVAVKDERSGQTAVLIRDEAISVSEGEIVKNVVRDGNYLAWKTGKLNFEGVPLDQVFDSLEEYYHVNISVKGPNVNLCKVTTRFEQESLEHVLKELSFIFGFTYRLEGKEVLISGVICGENE